MNPLEEQIAKILANPTEPVDGQWLKELMEEHPAFVFPVALYLKNHPHDISEQALKHLQAKVLLGCADRSAMSDLADLSGCDWSSFYPNRVQKRQKGTVETIDAFLDTYCKGSETDDALLERLIFNPVAADYMQAAEKEAIPDYPIGEMPVQEAPEAAEEEPQLPSDAIVDNGQSNLPDQAHEEPSLMESLVKIYIKQRRYERAYEIISNLSLKYPEKSAYFADQLRFLQKLIAIKQIKANSNGREA